MELGYSSFTNVVTEDCEAAIINNIELRHRHGNKHVIRNRTLHAWNASGIDTAEGLLMNVYDGRGKVAGTITLKRLTVLQTAFNHIQATAPNGMQELGATCIKHEVAKLLMKYQDGYTPHVDQHWQSTTLAQHFSTPDGCMHALENGLSLTCERLASRH